MFLRSKVALLRKKIRQSDVSAGENEIITRFSLAKVRISRSKVRFLRLPSRCETWWEEAIGGAGD